MHKIIHTKFEQKWTNECRDICFRMPVPKRDQMMTSSVKMTRFFMLSERYHAEDDTYKIWAQTVELLPKYRLPNVGTETRSNDDIISENDKIFLCHLEDIMLKIMHIKFEHKRISHGKVSWRCAVPCRLNFLSAGGKRLF